MFALSLAISGCALPEPVEPYPPLAADCSPSRIGRVSVEGATLDDVAPIGVLEGTLDDPDRADRIAETATELYQARGYPYAHLAVTRVAGCGTELHVKVVSGPHYTISDLAFDTDDAFPERERLLALEDALGTVNAIGGAYLPDRMARAVESLEHRYHEAGWIDAVIDPPRARFDQERGEVAIVVPIHAGPRYKIGRVVASGGAPEERRAVVRALGLRGGEWYSAPRLRVALGRARRKTDHTVEVRFEIAQDRQIVDLEARVR